jgi:hypothetical protein
MRVRRGPLFWGVFLVLLGGIPLLVRTGAIDGAVFADAWRFWPLILVAVGLAILVGHHRAGAAITVILALALGVAAGGALAAGTIPFTNLGDCVATRSPMERVTQAGTLDAPASIDLNLDCGELAVTTAATSTWSLDASHLGAPPTVRTTGSSLSVAAPEQARTHRQEWSLAVPADKARTIGVVANAATATFDLRGAALDRFRAKLNAGDLRLDATQARIGLLELTMNAGRARVSLAAGSTLGSLSVNAGAIDLCVPADAALILRVPDQLTFAHNLGQRGLVHDGDTWRRSGTDGNTIDLSVNGNAASFTLDPDGGC